MISKLLLVSYYFCELIQIRITGLNHVSSGAVAIFSHSQLATKLN